MPARTRSAFSNELKDLLRIPSVSTTEEHKDDVRKAAEVVAADLKRIGFENVEIIKTKGHPLVYADWLHAAGKPTALCYAHFDVQPAEPLDEWKSPPFIDKDAGAVKGEEAQAAKKELDRAGRAQRQHLCAWGGR
jgi:acetylornithine deacetylase/succinyl-diaminopimelate desuccinylase-like protein